VGNVPKPRKGIYLVLPWSPSVVPVAKTLCYVMTYLVSASPIQVLTILVKAVCEDLPDAKGEPASKLLKPLKELFGRITSKVPTDNPVCFKFITYSV